MIRSYCTTWNRKKIQQHQRLSSQLIHEYYQHLKERGNQRRDGALSNGHLNKHIQAPRKFAEYLRKVGRLQLPELPLETKKKPTARMAHHRRNTRPVQSLLHRTRLRISKNHKKSLQEQGQSYAGHLLRLWSQEK